jgi:hypothetical protein
MKFTRGNVGNGDKNDSNKKNPVNKKGVLLTSILVVGIISASFLVWLIPGGNNGSHISSNMTVTFLDPNITLTSIKSQFGLLKDEVENQVNAQKMNQTQNTSSFNSFVTASINQNEELMKTLLNGNPDQGLLPEYLTLMSEMKNYSIFLNNMKSNISI